MPSKQPRRTHPEAEHCVICGCLVHRDGGYAEPTPQGRSHATRHHLIPERFFGRSRNRRGTKRPGLFATCPWGLERITAVFCYECHEEMVHNPVFLPADLEALSELVRLRKLSERRKPSGRKKIAGRVVLLQEALSRGLQSLLRKERRPRAR